MASELEDIANRPDSPKPREELSYQEVYPDLNVKVQLPMLASAATLKKFSQDLKAMKENESENSLKLDERQMHYIRYKELDEQELNNNTEYDLEEDDFAWLHLYNQRERKPENLPLVSPEAFELVLDRLEKEWFELTKHIQKELAKEEEINYAMDEPCNICGEAETSHMNLIVFCDGCNLAVHQDCYGIPHIPEGPWLCRRCLLSPDTILKCIFCPTVGGAMKQTEDNRWAHSVCASWIPEVGFANQTYQEPIDSLARIPKARWQLVCSICNKKKGCCIQCSARTCRVSYHVTCAINNNFFLDELNSISYCSKHNPGNDENLFNQTTKVKLKHPQKRRPFVPLSLPKNSSSSKVQRINPVAPIYIVNKIVNEQMTKLGMKKKLEFVVAAAKYWALKREDLRGTPLLRRLRLEPWTPVTVETKEQNNTPERREALSTLRKDMEKIRILVAMIVKREKAKLKQVMLLYEIFDLISHPFQRQLGYLLDSLMKLDHKKYFWYPVNTDVVTDYTSIVKKPFCFQKMQEKVAANQYKSLKEFSSDFLLICSNALCYNKNGSSYYKAAENLKTLGLKDIKSVELYLNSIKVTSSSCTLDFDSSLLGTLSFEEHMKETICEEKRKSQKSPVKSPKKRKLEDISEPEKKESRRLNGTKSIIDKIEKPKSMKQNKTNNSSSQAITSRALNRKELAEIEFSSPKPSSFKKGDLVWAKVKSFPWFPAKIVDLKSSKDLIPDKVRNASRKDGDVLVKFIENYDSWAWVSKAELCQFKGESEFPLNNPKKMKKAYRSKLEEACIEARKLLK